MGREADAVDQVVADWRAARPDLDPAPLELVGRVLVLAQHLERSVEDALKPHDLTLGQFDILATLRRQPTAGGMTPTQLLQSVVLSSGGMTSRLDKLAERGLIARRPDPADRRGVIVGLTAKGRKLIDAATETRFREAARSSPPATTAERKQLAALLRAWLAAVESR
jgi:DNA-binding MarR family transcriptional regulator